MKAWIVFAALALAACGADGEPIRPEARATVTLSNQGVGLGGGVSVRRGPFSIGVSG